MKNHSFKEARREVDMFLRNMHTFRQTPMPEEKIIAYAKDFYLMVCEDEHMVNALNWKMKHGISTSSISRWRKKYPRFDEIYTDTLEFIAERMMDLALWKKADFNTMRLIIPLYSKEMRDLEEWRAKLRAKVEMDQEKKTIIVKVAEIPSVIDTLEKK